MGTSPSRPARATQDAHYAVKSNDLPGYAEDIPATVHHILSAEMLRVNIHRQRPGAKRVTHDLPPVPVLPRLGVTCREYPRPGRLPRRFLECLNLLDSYKL